MRARLRGNEFGLNTMKFCSQCGGSISVVIPQGDDRERFICDQCGVIHYQNPNVVTGCIPQWQDKILLCRRAIEPRQGFWTLPAGFMENGETAQEGAMREAAEEANARMQLIDLYTTFNLPHINQVYLFFRSKLLDLDFSAGAESLEVELFTEEEIPWDDLAFPVVTETLRLFFRDRKAGSFKSRIGDIHWQSRELRQYSVNLLTDG